MDHFIITNFRRDVEGDYYLLIEHYHKKKIKDQMNRYSLGFVVIKFNSNGNYVWACPVNADQVENKRTFLGTFSLNQASEAQYYYNKLENSQLRKGVPLEYGVNNYCGTNQVNFTPVGLAEEKIIRLDFPDINQQKFSILSRQLNPCSEGGSIYAIINKEKNIMMLGVVK